MFRHWGWEQRGTVIEVFQIIPDDREDTEVVRILYRIHTSDQVEVLRLRPGAKPLNNKHEHNLDELQLGWS